MSSFYECEYFGIFHRRLLGGGKVSRQVERQLLSLHVLCGK